MITAKLQQLKDDTNISQQHKQTNGKAEFNGDTELLKKCQTYSWKWKIQEVIKKSVENSISGMNQMGNSMPGPEGKVGQLDYSVKVNDKLK